MRQQRGISKAGWPIIDPALCLGTGISNERWEQPRLFRILWCIAVELYPALVFTAAGTRSTGTSLVQPGTLATGNILLVVGYLLLTYWPSPQLSLWSHLGGSCSHILTPPCSPVQAGCDHAGRRDSAALCLSSGAAALLCCSIQLVTDCTGQQHWPLVQRAL